MDHGFTIRRFGNVENLKPSLNRNKSCLRLSHPVCEQSSSIYCSPSWLDDRVQHKKKWLIVGKLVGDVCGSSATNLLVVVLSTTDKPRSISNHQFFTHIFCCFRGFYNGIYLMGDIYKHILLVFYIMAR